MDVTKNNKIFSKKKTFSVCKGALFNTLKRNRQNEEKHAEFMVLYSKIYIFVTRSVKILGYFKTNFSWLLTKNNKTFC